MATAGGTDEDIDVNKLKEEYEKREQELVTLQRHLKQAEHILSTALYQAKEKLKSIERSRDGAIPCEELITYAHRISADNSVAAPLNWEQGDPRRPYPQDVEMRKGWLGRLHELPIVDGHFAVSKQNTTAQDVGMKPASIASGTIGSATAAPWHAHDTNQPDGAGSKHSDNAASLNSHELPGAGEKKEPNLDDVEVMSTDSSSSSSSDSQ